MAPRTMESFRRHRGKKNEVPAKGREFNILDPHFSGHGEVSIDDKGRFSFKEKMLPTRNAGPEQGSAFTPICFTFLDVPLVAYVPHALLMSAAEINDAEVGHALSTDKIYRLLIPQKFRSRLNLPTAQGTTVANGTKVFIVGMGDFFIALNAEDRDRFIHTITGFRADNPIQNIIKPTTDREPRVSGKGHETLKPIEITINLKDVPDLAATVRSLVAQVLDRVGAEQIDNRRRLLLTLEVPSPSGRPRKPKKEK
ncbi:hypothetical protein KBD59_05985 [Candidatus Gracilibacteria bacterium]|nr:hypothetical protein [Candidatus Gracilibacteria bacterium]